MLIPIQTDVIVKFNGSRQRAHIVEYNKGSDSYIVKLHDSREYVRIPRLNVGLLSSKSTIFEIVDELMTI